MDFSFQKGQRLIIELPGEPIFEGNYESGTKDRIDVTDVLELPALQKIQGILSFYRNEIADIRIVEENGEETPQSPKDKNVLPGLQQSNIISLRSTEYERLKELTNNFIYMATMDKRFVDAIDHLDNCENIGVVGLGSEFGRMKSISLLVLSCWDQVYIFDLLLFHHKTFSPDLKRVLESESIRKVIHDSRRIVDCLWHHHKVEVKNVFDTQIADLIIEKKRNGVVCDTTRSLGDCLKHYFNFPNIIVEKSKSTNVKKWNERPLSDSRKRKAALLGTYLITLKNKLENIMLEHFYEVVNVYSNSLRKLDTFQARIETTKNDVPEEIKNIIE